MLTSAKPAEDLSVNRYPTLSVAPHDGLSLFFFHSLFSHISSVAIKQVLSAPLQNLPELARALLLECPLVSTSSEILTVTQNMKAIVAVGKPCCCRCTPQSLVKT